MSDIIKLLPDAVANQIAAGEVVQRPASLVKELLENSIDAGATYIKLLVRDAGRTLVQVIDNGKGMTETDARLAFERHATSKIRKAEDLFQITSMGFRGEALASIAAVAQVELKTKTELADLATEIKIEGSQVISQNYCQAAVGTVITVKNLFYNIPARRNFLKGENVEFKHIVDEFERIALAHPEVGFEFYNGNNVVFMLPATNLRQRISGIFSKKYNERLVPVAEGTDVVTLNGFVLKPEFARKTRGEQFFFVNHRFVKNHYLHHAIAEAFEGLLPSDAHPGYFLFLEIDPARIDVNIHPTKTEIKFDDERAIYAIIRVSVKHALGQFNVAPSLDFERETAFAVPPLQPGQQVLPPNITVNPHFNPFDDGASKPTMPRFGGHNEAPKNQPWQTFFEKNTREPQQIQIASGFADEDLQLQEGVVFQIFNTYIARRSKTNLILIHQNRAHQRVLYDRFLASLQNHSGASQQLLFPHQLPISAGDLSLLQPVFEDLRQLGFDVEPLGQNMLVVQGIPLAVAESESIQALEEIIEGLKNSKENFGLNKNNHLALVLAKHGATKAGKVLATEEMLHLADQLFACQMPQIAPDGKAVVIHLNKEEIDKFFN